jgi:class 3 adenylate cyclase
MDDRIFDEFIGQTMIGLVSIAVGVIFLAFDHRTRGSVALCCFWTLAGVAVITTPLVAGQVDPDHVRLVERLHVLLEAGAVVSVCVYIEDLAATADASRRARIVVTAIARVAAGASVVFAALGATLTATRLNDFSLALHGTHALERSGFWLFGSFWIFLGVAFIIAWVIMARQRIDPGERGRAIMYGAAVPFTTSATFLAPRGAIVAFTIGMICGLAGTFRYLLVQGERVAFLSRFLSPQVAELVRMRGLTEVMQPQEVDLSVVCVDFRGFTSYAEAVPSRAVIDLISDYHEAIAEAVAEHDGMVKDYAGDGILILVGAPIPRQDHAAAAVSMARTAMEAAHAVTDRWATGPHPLGVGIGVATGRVTVGAIGDTARMDYTAVGTAMNVAARLCGAAEDGAILIDEPTAKAVTGMKGVDFRSELDLKGMSTPIAVYSCATESAVGQRAARYN